MRKVFKVGLSIMLLIILMALTFAGCSSKQTISYDEYLKVFEKATSLEGQVQTLQMQNDLANDQIATLKKQLADETAKHSSIEQSNRQLQQEVSTLQARLTAEMSGTDIWFQQKYVLEKENESLKTINKQTQENYTTVLGKYNKLLAIYPPKKFASLQSLTDWRKAKGVVTSVTALYQLGLDDGYLLIPRSGDCLAVVGDSLYRLLPADPAYVVAI